MSVCNARFSLRAIVFASLAIFFLLETPPGANAQNAPPPLIQSMHSEIGRAMSDLAKGAKEGQPAPYFISYEARDSYRDNIMAQQGALLLSDFDHRRTVDAVIRVGSHKLDNTHGTHRASGISSVALPLSGDSATLERTLWWATNRGYGRALESYLRVKTEAEVDAKQEDESPDFSEEQPVISIGSAVEPPKVDHDLWNRRIRALSTVFRGYPHVDSNLTIFTVIDETQYFVSSEGAEIVSPHRMARVVVFASTTADDGMQLSRSQTFEAETAAGLPSQQVMTGKIEELAAGLEKLRAAPLAVPFDGPAILSGRAAAVFFHEVLGHRLEGQRQKGSQEGQTFTKQLGKEILPSFLSVADDPTTENFQGQYLSGYYQYDDEGQKARRVDLVQNGVLKDFLMSRLPIAHFDHSNGHGRSQAGLMPAGRQGNLIVSSTRSESENQLRKDLIAQIRKQGRPYGLYFEDISSGFADTRRTSPQAFEVHPMVVYRVYADGRPDELVRGVSIVGTPMSALQSILATGNRQNIFNGECGAESGSIPVAAIAPAMLVREIETQKQPQGTERPPILPPPNGDSHGGAQ